MATDGVVAGTAGGAVAGTTDRAVAGITDRAGAGIAGGACVGWHTDGARAGFTYLSLFVLQLWFWLPALLGIHGFIMTSD